MARSRAAPKGANPPREGGSPEGCSGQGAGSALREMLRRQAQNPRPGAVEKNAPAREADGRPAPAEAVKRRG